MGAHAITPGLSATLTSKMPNGRVARDPLAIRELCFAQFLVSVAPGFETIAADNLAREVHATDQVLEARIGSKLVVSGIHPDPDDSSGVIAEGLIEPL